MPSKVFNGKWEWLVNKGQDNEDYALARPEAMVFLATVDEYLPDNIRTYAKNHKRNFGLLYFRANNDSINDIAVPACLPKKSAPKPGMICYISGIGTTKEMTTAPIKILSKDECSQYSSAKDYKKHEDLDIIQWDICGLTLAENCQPFLNAGSPLICKEDGKAVVYGVASLILDSNDLISLVCERSNDILFIQGKNEESNSCKELAMLFTDVHLHSVFIDCVLEWPDDSAISPEFFRREHMCQKRQEESEDYCDNSANREFEFPDSPDCGL